MSEPFSGFCVHFGVLKACAFWVSCPVCPHCCKLAAARVVCHQAVAHSRWGMLTQHSQHLYHLQPFLTT